MRDGSYRIEWPEIYQQLAFLLGHVCLSQHVSTGMRMRTQEKGRETERAGAGCTLQLKLRFSLVEVKVP